MPGEDLVATSSLDKTTNELIAEMAASVPGGFGGAFYDASGDVIVWLTDLEQAEAAVDALMGFQPPGAPEHRRVSRGRIKVRQAAYDWIELSQWFGLAIQAWAPGETLLMDIDEATNKIFIGVREMAIEARLRSALETAGIPTGAVDVGLQSPILPAVASTVGNAVDTSVGAMTVMLTSTAPTPYYAGFKIEGTGVPGGGACTMGPQVTISGSLNGFITASHCTDQVYASDGNTQFQPVLTGNLIGNEYKDKTTISHPSCPPVGLCRKSDAAVIKYNTAAWSGVGLIARVTGIGSKTLTTTPDDEWRVVDDTPSCAFFATTCFPPIVGKTMNYVGHVSGWKQGTLTRSCVVSEYLVGGTPVAVICVDEVQGAAAGGDSGAAVFELTGHPRDVDLWGILTSSTTAGTHWFISRIEGIKQEVGSFNAKAPPVVE